MVSGDNHAACFTQAGDVWFAWLAWFYSYLFLVSTAILLLNMLIAMMAKTFDSVWESAEISSQCLFARAVFFQRDRPPEPPPLNILRVPWYVLWSGVRLAMLALPKGSEAHRCLSSAAQALSSGFGYSPFVTHTSPVATNLDKNDEYCGTEVEGRNTFKNWKRSMTFEEKGDIILQFVLNHQDEATMTHRWRTKMIKRLTGEFREHTMALNQRLDRQEELMSAQQRTLEALQRTLHTLCSDSSSEALCGLE